MIHTLRLNQFRNFSSREFIFKEGKNIIIAKNGCGKTNILEALALPIGSLLESDPQYLVAKNETLFHIEYGLETGKYSISYDKLERKKRFFSEKKQVSKPKFQTYYPHIISFHPMVMNMMYLAPSERRSFLDQILVQSHTEYKKELSKYQKILTSRNKILKNISEGNSQKSELQFWNRAFIESASYIYLQRNILNQYISQHIGTLKKYFFGKIETIEFEYLSKINFDNISANLEKYLVYNEELEIRSRRTSIGPHLDDFEIRVDGTPLIHYASRGEVKSSILGLKFLETQFIEKKSAKKEILFLIDDLLSELDHDHREKLWEHIGERQCIVTSIENNFSDGNIINL